jgi:hypothetical protein
MHNATRWASNTLQTFVALAGLAFSGTRVLDAQTTASAAFSAVVKDALATDMKIADFIVAEGALVTVSTLKTVGCDIGNFVVGRILPAGVPGPYDICGTTQSGAGFYMFGTNGPGGIMPFNRFTVYLPTTNVGCAARDYTFSFSLSGPNKLTNYANQGAAMFNKGGALDLYTSKMGVPNAVTAWKALYESVGDFAIMVAFNPLYKSANVYIMATNAPKLSSLISSEANLSLTAPRVYGTALAQATSLLTKSMAGSTEGIVLPNVVHTGSSFTNQKWGLACNSPLVFYYMVGTGNLVLN